MLYSLVQNNIPGPPGPLPQTWMGMSNFYAFDDNTIASYGFYPCHTSDQPQYNPATQKLVETLTLGDAEVFQTWQVVALTPEEQIAFATARLTEIANRITPFLNESVARRGYEDHVSARTVRGSANPKWAQDGLEAWAYYDLVWNQFTALQTTVEDAVMAGIEAGTIPLPTAEDWLAALPVLWPASAPSNMSNGTFS